MYAITRTQGAVHSLLAPCGHLQRLELALQALHRRHFSAAALCRESDWQIRVQARSHAGPRAILDRVRLCSESWQAREGFNERGRRQLQANVRNEVICDGRRC